MKRARSNAQGPQRGTSQDQENVDVFTRSRLERPSRSLLKRVQHDHTYKDTNGNFVKEIVPKVYPDMPRLYADRKVKRNEVSDWPLGRLNAGESLVCSDEGTYHVGGPERHKKRKVTVPKGVRVEYLTNAVNLSSSLLCIGNANLPSRPQNLWDNHAAVEIAAAVERSIWENEQLVAAIEEQ